MNELTENTFSAPANPFRPANSTQTNSVEISVPHAEILLRRKNKLEPLQKFRLQWSSLE